MNEIATTKSHALATQEDIFSIDNLDDLVEGAGGGFPVLSIRGGKWRVKSGGEETVITDSEGDPVASVPIVLVKAQREVSKIYYAKNYEEGDDEAPDCYSMNGVAPDAAAPNPQAKKCATCPMNQWGSRITDSGKKAKRCSDNRRIVVVPAARKMDKADPGVLRNEVYGGPMLLRIPPASLKDMAKYAGNLRSKVQENYNAVVTVLGFDTNVSFPKLTFKAARRLTSDEKDVIVELFVNGAVDNILETPEHAVAPEGHVKVQATVDVEFEDDSIPEERPAARAKAKPAEEQVELDLDLDEGDLEVEAKPAKPQRQTRKKKAAKAATRKGNGSAAAEKPSAAAAEIDPDLVEGLDDITDQLDELDDIAF